MSNRFDTTQWSVVLAARHRDETGAEEALTQLCEAYWYPLYAFVRRQGYPADQAQELTQGYFLKLLEKDYLSDVDRSAGRFRSFLLASMKHFLANERTARRTAKRGGGKPVLSLDVDTAENMIRTEAVDAQTPEAAFEKQWARVVLHRTTFALRDEHEQKGQLDRFERLEPFLTGETSGRPYAEIASDLGQSESAVKMIVLRLRRRFGQLLRQEISRTVAEPWEVDAEIRYLFDVLQR